MPPKRDHRVSALRAGPVMTGWALREMTKEA
jgi:hypothetical protein